MSLLHRWLQPQAWVRDGGDAPAIGLGVEDAFDDMHLFAPCAFYEKGLFRMYNPGSRGDVARRVFRMGHASSADGVAFRKHPEGPVFEVGDDVHFGTDIVDNTPWSTLADDEVAEKAPRTRERIMQELAWYGQDGDLRIRDRQTTELGLPADVFEDVVRRNAERWCPGL